VLLGQRVIYAGGAARASQDRVAEAGGEHPLDKPVAGVAERGFECLALTGGESVERHGEVMDAGPCHLLAPSARLLPRVRISAGLDSHQALRLSVDRADRSDTYPINVRFCRGSRSCRRASEHRPAVVARRPHANAGRELTTSLLAVHAVARDR